MAGDPSGELVTVTLGGGKGLPALAVGACHNLGAAAAKMCCFKVHVCGCRRLQLQTCSLQRQLYFCRARKPGGNFAAAKSTLQRRNCLPLLQVQVFAVTEERAVLKLNFAAEKHLCDLQLPKR